MSKSKAELCFAQAWRMMPFPARPEMVREYAFHPVRQWRFDFAIVSLKLAVELDGLGRGKQTLGHHGHEGIRRDCEKLNAAIELGWRVMRYPSFEKQNALEWARQVYRVAKALQAANGSSSSHDGK